jgi:hypothetical protein
MSLEPLVHQGADGFWTFTMVQVTGPVGVKPPKLGVKVAVLWKPDASFKKSTRSKTISGVTGGIVGAGGAGPAATQTTLLSMCG